MVGVTRVAPARFMLEHDIDPHSDVDQYLALTHDEEEDGDDGVISYWSEDNGKLTPCDELID